MPVNQESNFETTFSHGLDLSEFVSGSTGSLVPNASASLLRVKEIENIHKQKEENEERLMQQKAARKAQEQLRRLEEGDKCGEKKCDRFYGVLVSMHGSDSSGGKREQKHAKTKAQKRTVSLKFKRKSIHDVNHKNTKRNR